MIRFKLLLTFALLCLVSSLHAQDAGTQPVEKKPEFPKSGVLSRTVNTGYQSRNFNMPWSKKGDTPAPDQPPPISGSVSKLSEREWVAKIFNNTKDTYSVSLRVVQRNNGGNFLKSDSFSTTLKPGERVERTVAAAMGSADAALSLESWKNLSEQKRTIEEKKREAAAQAKTAPGAAPSPAGAPQRR